MDKQRFLQNMRFLLNSRQGIVSHLDEFIGFDPQARTASVATQQAINALAEELKQRGMEETPRASIPLSQKDAVDRWVKGFAEYTPTNSNIPFAQQHDAALVPALRAYEEARESLRAYCRDRIEHTA